MHCRLLHRLLERLGLVKGGLGKLKGRKILADQCVAFEGAADCTSCKHQLAASSQQLHPCCARGRPQPAGSRLVAPPAPAGRTCPMDPSMTKIARSGLTASATCRISSNSAASCLWLCVVIVGGGGGYGGEDSAARVARQRL